MAQLSVARAWPAPSARVIGPWGGIEGDRRMVGKASITRRATISGGSSPWVTRRSLDVRKNSLTGPIPAILSHIVHNNAGDLT